jgi:hypothetical protein
VLRRRVHGQWSTEATVQSEHDDFVALGCATKEVTLLTTNRLIDEGSDKKSAVALSEKLQAGWVTSVLVTPDQVFIGINRGEWGGGLRRIDRRSGRVTTIEHNATGQLCGGPLNTECDPVNGIASESWRPDCVAVAVGLVHFEPSGRIVEVCGDNVQRLYEKPYGEAAPLHGQKTGDKPSHTVAFFGLTREGDALLAAGIDGIYRIEASGTKRSAPLPAFKKIGDFRVSFDLPHLVVVLTNINRGHSLSGSVPILLPR